MAQPLLASLPVSIGQRCCPGGGACPLTPGRPSLTLHPGTTKACLIGAGPDPGGATPDENVPTLNIFLNTHPGAGDGARQLSPCGKERVPPAPSERSGPTCPPPGKARVSPPWKGEGPACPPRKERAPPALPQERRGVRLPPMERRGAHLRPMERRGSRLPPPKERAHLPSPWEGEGPPTVERRGPHPPSP